MTTQATSGQANPERVGEVISANSTSFVVQCYQLYGSPGLGSFVRAGSPGIYGVVSDVRTEPLDPSRPVLARGQDDETEEDVYAGNPQIYRLLTSRCDVVTIGSTRPGGFDPWLPPLPPRVHSFVYVCGLDETGIFAADLRFLGRLARPGCPASDDVIRACVQGLNDARPGESEVALRAGRALAAELTSDFPRINAILAGIGR